MDKNDPSVKLNMRLNKKQLIKKARNLGLPETGSKLDLAKRVTLVEEKRYTKIWDSIANG